MPELPNKAHLFFIKNSRAPYDEEAISLGFRWLLQNAEDKTNGKAFLAVPSVSSLSRGKAIRGILGEPTLNALMKNRRANFNNKIFFQLITADDLGSLVYASSPVILAIFPNGTLLDALEGYSSISSILVVPKHFIDVKHWIEKWKAIEL